jgi:hypothetical protein
MERNPQVHEMFRAMLDRFSTLPEATAAARVAPVSCIYHVFVQTEDGERCDVCGARRS